MKFFFWLFLGAIIYCYFGYPLAIFWAARLRPRKVLKAAADTVKPVLLELGGKAPLVVLDDADLDAAVAAAAFGAFMNQGQICMSTERLVVDQKVADAFVAKLAANETLHAAP